MLYNFYKEAKIAVVDLQIKVRAVAICRNSFCNFIFCGGYKLIGDIRYKKYLFVLQLNCFTAVRES